ncbi:MAG TPA: MFS transporter [Rhizomicrobium sp.]|nr:MFS transporter [Rhizomicrobium sp.]
MSSHKVSATGLTAKAGLYFVLLFGAVNLFADFSYEGARSVSGPFLALLGASGFIVGSVGGLGELLGYALRLVSGRWADRSHRYWLITGLGYLLQMSVIPLLALAASWQAAAALILMERMGKAVRNPPRDVMLSEAGRHMGVGWAFGINEALDQIGAFLGPLAVAAIYALRADYRLAFAWLAAPGAMVLLLVLSARLAFPQAGRIAPGADAERDGAYPKIFWWYAVGAALVAFGFADYALIAFHFAKSHTLAATTIPIVYAFAMLGGGAGALLFGRLFDRFGLNVLPPAIVICALFAPLSFLGSGWVATAGVLLWGLGLGVQESVMSAAVATMIPAARRASAYGVFTAIFGVAWFLGSALEGALYDISIPALVALSLTAQLLAIPFILKATRG